MSPEPATRISSPESGSASTTRIWVGSLSDYNAGVLFGDWLDANRGLEEVHADIAHLLAASPTAREEGVAAEEFGIFDYEGFGPARVHQYDPIDQVCALARGIAEHGPAFAAWVSIGDQPREDHTRERFEEAYLGHFASIAEYVYQFVDDMGYNEILDRALPDGIRAYVKVDVDGLARDLELSGDLVSVDDLDGGVWLFEADR